MIKEKKYILGIIGFGNMGSALLSGIIKSNLIKNKFIAVFDKDNEKNEKAKLLFNVKCFDNLKELIINSKYILVAIKPQNIKDIISELKNYCDFENNIVLSIAAGITTNFYEENIGQIPIIRIMPNTPAIYNKGISAISLGKFAKKEHEEFALQLMRSVGETIVIEEKFQNLVTALSGSGPAYFFLICKIMIDFAIENGVKEDIAKKLVFNTLIGSGEILINSNKTIDDLIKSVASPGGTTEAALKKFKDLNLKEILFNALNSALNRSFEIEKSIF